MIDRRTDLNALFVSASFIIPAQFVLQHIWVNQLRFMKYLTNVNMENKVYNKAEFRPH